MARGVELATAYVTLTAETSEISKSIGKAFSNADRAAASTGTSMGRALKSAFAKEKPVDTEKLSKDLESAERRHTAAVEKGARDRANAQRQVEVAEARVQEVRERTIRQAQAVKDAEKALERARKDGDPDQVAAAEKRLAEARENVKPSSADLAAEDRLIRARQNQERVNLETASSVDKLEGELKDAKRAVDDAAKSTDSTARKFTSMGDRIKAAMKGDFGKAFARVKRDGKDAADDLERGFKKAGEDSGSGFSSGFKKLAFAAGGLFAADQVKDFAVSSFMSAADLEQSTGAVETVFKQHSAKMLKYAQDADQALGMSENSYNELATILGTQLRNAGMKDFAEQTNDLIGLGADFSAMFGGTATEAVEAISSALKGERDPIEKYGISLRQSAIDAKAAELGFKKVGGSYDQQAQAAATLALINEQSTDAQGAFNRELGTSSNVIQRAKAWFEDFTAAIGSKLLPAFSKVGNWVLDKGIPIFDELGWAAENIWSILFEGDFKGSFFGIEEDSELLGYLFDFRDAMVDLWNNALVPLGDWVKAHWKDILAFFAGFGGTMIIAGLVTLAGAIGGLIASISWIPLAIGAAVGALTWFFTQTEIGRSIFSAVVDWITGTAWPALQGAFKAIGDAATWLWENAIIPAWDGIKGAIGAVVGWIMNSAVPFLQTAWDSVAGAAQWLWQSVIAPAWEGIRMAIALAIASIMTYIDGWVWLFQNTVAPVFDWLWRNVIVPAWGGIRSAISAVVSWFQNTAWPLLRTTIEAIKLGFNAMRDALKAAWQFVKDNAISPVVNWFKNVAWPLLSGVIGSVKTGFNVMRDSINKAWNFVKNRAIAPVVDWFSSHVWPKIQGVTDNIKNAFNNMKDAVGRAWQGIKNAAIEPVNFVINKVYNEGIYSNFENVRKHIPGLPKLPEFHGFARGGILPGFSRMRDGDDQLVPMRRGEGVLVSEALRTARDKAAFLAVNAAGRRGQGFADTVGFAGGGILDKAGQLAGDVLDGGKKLLKGAWDFVSDPVGAFKGLVGGLLKKIPGAGFFADLAAGVGRKILDGVVSKVSAAFSPASNPDAAPVSVPPGASRSLGYAQKVARGMGLTMTSFRRRGARTAGSGVTSLHALGRAMDFSNGVNTKAEMAFFNVMHALKPTELLFSPAGRRQWHRSGRMGDTSGITKRMHYNHVHVGFARGGIIPASIIGGYKPFLHDRGGWHMPGELSINQTQKPEAVLTAKQWETVARSLDHATSSGVTVNVTAPTSQDPGVFGQRLGDALQLRQLAGSVA
ncbi:hypothetical protein DHOM_02940 [Dermabacter hominis 1368]|uniref:Phage tail tape measure protein domain-containing protein n=1 Tax=Dermabacter hominis 1368 TaxID=1450519 RepID=A0ABR4SM68_9MICO|nr:hypothetical protein DHOM_02940 [Dermabacter hominis 1368]